MALPIRPPASTQSGQVYGPPVILGAPPTPHAANPNANQLNPGPQGTPNKVPSLTDSVKAMQTFLNNRGFKIAIDGVRGPQTNAAVLAFHKGIKGDAWTKSQNPGNGTRPGGPGARGNGTTVPPVSTTPPAKTKPAGKTTTAANANAADPLIDPAAYASGTVNAQYDPQIAALLLQTKQGTAAEASHTQQIQDWFNQALAAAKQGAMDNAQVGKDALSSYDQSGQNILNLFGGPGANNSTASEAAAFHDIGRSNLASDVLANSQFDKNMQTIEAGAGAQAQRSQFNTDQQNLKDLASQLVSLRGAKGQAYNAAYQTGVQNRTQQEAAQQSLALAKSLAPAQVATAKANAKTAAANAAVAGTNAKTNLAIAKARLKQANAATAAAAAASGGKWDLSQPKQQGALQQAYETNIIGPKGGLSLNPETAWANLQQQMQMNGLANDPHAQAIAQGVFLQGLWTSHSMGNFGGFAWDGKKIVRTGNRYVAGKNGQHTLVNAQGKPVPDYKPKR